MARGQKGEERGPMNRNRVIEYNPQGMCDIPGKFMLHEDIRLIMECILMVEICK